MRNRFVRVENVVRFEAAIDRLQRKGAAEKQIVLISGEAGLGKSRTALWWALQHDAVQLTCKPTMTPGWLLRDLLGEMGKPAARRTSDAFDRALAALMENPRPIVVDEVEDVLKDDAAALDMLRKAVDLVELPLVLVGRERTNDKIMRQPQLATRVAGVAEFRPLSIEDVVQVMDELVEGDVEEDLIAEAYKQSGGYIREVMTAAAEIDAAAHRSKDGVARLTQFKGKGITGPLSRGVVPSNVVPIRGAEAANG